MFRFPCYNSIKKYNWKSDVILKSISINYIVFVLRCYLIRCRRLHFTLFYNFLERRATKKNIYSQNRYRNSYLHGRIQDKNIISFTAFMLTRKGNNSCNKSTLSGSKPYIFFTLTAIVLVKF